MNYTFHLCRCDSRFEYPQAWYLELAPSNFELIEKMHKCIAEMHFLRTMRNPHVETLHSNPVVLSAMWLEKRIGDALAGRTFLVNACGGGFYLDDNTVIIETVQKDGLRWDAVIEGEKITIQRWEGQPHWYLSSSKNRIFDPIKYVRIEDAKAVALMYVEEDNINIKD